jgi:Septum formation
MSLLIRPLLVFLTIIIIVVLLLMLIFGGFGGGGDDGADSAAKTEQTDAPKADTSTADDTKADAPEVAEPKQRDPIAAADLKVGVCISDALSTLGDVTTFDEAQCDEPHDGEVYTLIKLVGADGAKYPGTKFVTGKGQRGCRARLRRQATAHAFRDRQLGYKFVYPTKLSWADGDREITCLATFKKPRSEKLPQR